MPASKIFAESSREALFAGDTASQSIVNIADLSLRHRLAPNLLQMALQFATRSTTVMEGP